MSNNSNKKCQSSCHHTPCVCFIKTDSNGPFLSSYVDAVGASQTINANRGVLFGLDSEDIDIIGESIRVTNDVNGTLFTINEPGLYSVEWSLNLSSGVNPILIGLLENDSPTSALSNVSTIGNYSSGALIYVDSVPYTVRLFNFGTSISIADATGYTNTAASIRIFKFADGPNT